jgi:transaldolase
VVSDRPVSFEVLGDDFDDMERQALKIASWGDNVFVKIPVTNTRAEISAPLIGRLTDQGVQVNATAVMTVKQVEEVAASMGAGRSGFISLFAGRVADTGRDPVPLIAESVALLAAYPRLELIWASPREILNVFQADATGCHVITVTHDLLKKLPLVGKDLDEFSLETVKMFFDDARAAGYTL